jgi:hypothetical protein
MKIFWNWFFFFLKNEVKIIIKKKKKGRYCLTGTTGLWAHYVWNSEVARWKERDVLNWILFNIYIYIYIYIFGSLVFKIFKWRPGKQFFFFFFHQRQIIVMPYVPNGDMSTNFLDRPSNIITNSTISHFIN